MQDSKSKDFLRGVGEGMPPDPLGVAQQADCVGLQLFRNGYAPVSIHSLLKHVVMCLPLSQYYMHSEVLNSRDVDVPDDRFGTRFSNFFPSVKFQPKLQNSILRDTTFRAVNTGKYTVAVSKCSKTEAEFLSNYNRAFT